MRFRRAILEIDTVDVPSLMRSISTLVSQRAEEKGIAFEIDVPENLPAIEVNERKLKQTFLKLLSNAVKLTGAGGCVTLTARCEAGQGHEFRIADTGIAMAAEEFRSPSPGSVRSTAPLTAITKERVWAFR